MLLVRMCVAAFRFPLSFNFSFKAGYKLLRRKITLTGMYVAVPSVKLGIALRNGQVSRGGLET